MQECGNSGSYICNQTSSLAVAVLYRNIKVEITACSGLTKPGLDVVVLENEYKKHTV